MVLRLTVAERSMVDPVTRLEDVIRIVEIPARGTDYGGEPSSHSVAMFWLNTWC